MEKIQGKIVESDCESQSLFILRDIEELSDGYNYLQKLDEFFEVDFVVEIFLFVKSFFGLEKKLA